MLPNKQVSHLLLMPQLAEFVALSFFKLPAQQARTTPCVYLGLDATYPL